MIDTTSLKQLVGLGKTLRVLYVEDHPESRKSTLFLLENFFDLVTVAVDGMDGLEKFQEGQYDLIISDINMPNMNGIEMLTKIKKLDNQIPCILLSAHNDISYFLDAIELSVDGYIVKPVGFKQLINTLNKTLYKIKLEQENREYKKNLLNQIKIQQETIISQGKFAAMGEMLQMIAHQWRQPLNVINLNVMTIKMMVDQKKIKKQKFDDIVEHISDTVAHMSQTIEDFRDFLTINNKSSEIPIIDLAYKPMHLIEAQMDVMGISFKFQSNVDKDKKIFIDSSKFFQIMLNLYKNSIDEFKGKDIEAPFIKVGILDDDNKLIITVEDNAGGIPEDIMSEIFNPYFSTKGKNGTGIGLYMSKKIIEDHIKGDIKVENTQKGALYP